MYPSLHVGARGLGKVDLEISSIGHLESVEDVEQVMRGRVPRGPHGHAPDNVVVAILVLAVLGIQGYSHECFQRCKRTGFAECGRGCRVVCRAWKVESLVEVDRHIEHAEIEHDERVYSQGPLQPDFLGRRELEGAASHISRAIRVILVVIKIALRRARVRVCYRVHVQLVVIDLVRGFLLLCGWVVAIDPVAVSKCIVALAGRSDVWVVFVREQPAAAARGQKGCFVGHRHFRKMASSRRHVTVRFETLGHSFAQLPPSWVHKLLDRYPVRFRLCLVHGIAYCYLLLIRVRTMSC